MRYVYNIIGCEQYIIYDFYVKQILFLLKNTVRKHSEGEILLQKTYTLNTLK